MKRVNFDVNQKLKAFNSWFDEFILVAAKPLAILGFAMGTVDIFTRGGIATAWWFNVPWAIVQALTIDGLFFSVWYRLFSGRWSWSKIVLGFVGIVLAMVAVTTNGILSLQQLQGIADSSRAMAWLGIDPIAFTVARAFLVVFVSIMVAFVYYHRTDGTAVVPVEQLPEQRSEQWNTDWDTVLNSTNNQWNNWYSRWNNGGTVGEQWVEHGGTVVEQPRTVVVPVVEQPLLIPEHSENSDRDKLRSLFQQAKDNNAPINLVEAGRKSGIAYGRVRKLAPAIKKEVGV